MSLILDALNKAQRERQEKHEPVPHLASVHAIPPPADLVLRRRRLYAGIMATAVVVAIMVAIAFGISDRSDPPVVEPAKIATSAHTQAPVRPANDSQTHSSEQLARARDMDPAPAPRVVPASPPDLQQAATPADEDVVNLYQSARRSVETPAPSNVSQPTATPKPANAQVARIEQPAPPPEGTPAPVKDSLLDYGDIGYVQDLSRALQDTLPSLMYSKHRYDPQVAGRSVVINGTTYRAGARIAPDLVVEDILRDGILLRYQNQPFKMKALNSWVNL